MPGVDTWRPLALGYDPQDPPEWWFHRETDNDEEEDDE